MRAYRLKPSCRLIKEDAHLFVFIGETQVRIKTHGPRVFELLERLIEGATVDALVELMPQKQVEDILRKLIDVGLVIPVYENDFLDTEYAKHIDFFAELGLDPNKIQRSLQERCVLLIGVGGVGSIVLQHLVALGVESFILIDKDTVELK